MLNAEILFDHFYYRLIQLCFSILWESCSIGSPASIFRVAAQWLGKDEAHQMLSVTAVAHDTEEVAASASSVDDDEMIQHLLSPCVDASPPGDYEMLRTHSIAELRERGDLVLSQRPCFNGDTTMFLRILSRLGIAKLLERPPSVMDRLAKADYATEKVSRLHAANLACVIRILVELDAEHSGSSEYRASSGTVERIHAIVARCAYAHGETDPQVVREMWRLQEALITVGKYEEAQEVEQDAYRQMESYVQDIPVYSA
jgi:hypothetical protein